MNLMISENILQPALLRTRGNIESDTISYGMRTSDLGELLVDRSIKGVCAILIGSDHEELDLELATRFPKADLVADEADVHDDLAKVINFMNKPANGLYLPLDMRGTPFHRRVWEKLRDSHRKDRDVYRCRVLGRSAHLSAGRRRRLRLQPACSGCSLPSRRAQQSRSGRATAGASSASGK
jgi:hypothetical protein